MTMPFGLAEHTVEQIKSVFEAHPEISEVVLYGSRAKGNYKPGSDIDLACRGHNLTHTTINKIHRELDELLLPYTIDLTDIKAISNKDLLDHITRVGKVFYHRTDK